MKSLKEIYGLFYDDSGFNSGLIQWYNRLIDKSYETLDIIDVCKMFRQDILYDVALEKAIDLFLNDPYDGEYCDGGLLETLVSVDISTIKQDRIDKLKTMLEKVKKTFSFFDWEDEELKENYNKNMDEMLKKIHLCKGDQND
ncbi:MAG: contact-dependent growth inhibition system immunity protein [Oscillospiraceae bacterium]|nr:contact-dependent growth inhibition system immunity protein [Oscillospiraceae bacterium]